MPFQDGSDIVATGAGGRSLLCPPGVFGHFPSCPSGVTDCDPHVLSCGSQSAQFAQNRGFQADLSCRASCGNPTLNGYLVAPEDDVVDDRPKEFLPALMGEAGEVACRLGAIC